MEKIASIGHTLMVKRKRRKRRITERLRNISKK
jgi:hypothetical protein